MGSMSTGWQADRPEGWPEYLEVPDLKNQIENRGISIEENCPGYEEMDNAARKKLLLMMLKQDLDREHEDKKDGLEVDDEAHNKRLLERKKRRPLNRNDPCYPTLASVQSFEMDRGEGNQKETIWNTWIPDAVSTITSNVSNLFLGSDDEESDDEDETERNLED